MCALGGYELDLFTDPGCVRVCVADAAAYVMWAALPTSAPAAHVQVLLTALVSVWRAAQVRLARVLVVQTANLSPAAPESGAESDNSDGVSACLAHSLLSAVCTASSAASALLAGCEAGHCRYAAGSHGKRR
jgi:hypothetical protein